MKETNIPASGTQHNGPSGAYDQEQVNYNRKNIGLLTFTAMLGGISVGYNLGIIGGACLYIDEVFPEKVTLADKSVSTHSSYFYYYFRIS